jgi:hypothetical protein
MLHPSLRVQTRPKPSDFFERKNPQHAFLQKGSKAVCPMSQICGMLKNPVITWKLGHNQNLSTISRPISSLANRGLWRLRGVERLWSWRKELRAVHRGPVTSRPRCIGVTRTANQSTIYLKTSALSSLCTVYRIHTTTPLLETLEWTKLLQ